jgi:pyruvate/2-oxoacid:ferredoxin oxidoreductase alpha subunit
MPADKKVSGFVAGLGGRDITPCTIQGIINDTKGAVNVCKFVDLNEKILFGEFKV